MTHYKTHLNLQNCSDPFPFAAHCSDRRAWCQTAHYVNRSCVLYSNSLVINATGFEAYLVKLLETRKKPRQAAVISLETLCFPTRFGREP